MLNKRLTKKLSFKHLMINPIISIPPHYDAQRFCLLSYELPLLKHCFIICTQYKANVTAFVDTDFSFLTAEAQRLSQQCVGNLYCYIILFSGETIRRRNTAHAHVFIVQRRWQKALVYSLLVSKNWGLAIANILHHHLPTTSYP